MKLKSLFNAGETLEKASSRSINSTKLSFYIAKFMAETETDRLFFKTKFLELLKKNGCEIKSGDTVTIPKENQESWSKDYNELISIDVEEPKTKIPLSLLVDGAKLSPQEMIYLLPFIDEDK